MPPRRRAPTKPAITDDQMRANAKHLVRALIPPSSAPAADEAALDEGIVQLLVKVQQQREQEQEHEEEEPASEGSPIQQALDSLPPLRRVLAALTALGLPGGYICFPGYLTFDCGDGVEWCFGTANGTWGGEVGRDGELHGSFETDLPPDADPAAVAAALLAGAQVAVQEAERERQAMEKGTEKS